MTDIGQLRLAAEDFRGRLQSARESIGDGIPWYPYDILGNIAHLEALLPAAQRDLDGLSGGGPVADIGGADGDLSFLLEAVCGWEIDLVDTAATNMNGLRGAAALRDHLGSRVRIEDINLDEQFRLPRERYGLIFVLGLLYHLQNPFYFLRELAGRAEHCLLSTRVARFAGGGRKPVRIAELPVAYLVGQTETNNDPTNYWVFSPAGLEQIVARTGWQVVARRSVGDLQGSNPSSAEHDERCFMLLRSPLAAVA